MEDIGHETRKAKSSIYYYFANKEEVFKAVIEEEAAILRKELRDATQGINDPVQKLKVHVVVRMHTMKGLVNYYAAIRQEYDAHLPFIEALRERFDADEVASIREILEQGVDQGKFEVIDTELGAVAIVTALKGLEVPLIWKPDASNLEARLDKMLKILFYGILKR